MCSLNIFLKRWFWEKWNNCDFIIMLNVEFTIWYIYYPWWQGFTECLSDSQKMNSFLFWSYIRFYWHFYESVKNPPKSPELLSSFKYLLTIHLFTYLSLSYPSTRLMIFPLNTVLQEVGFKKDSIFQWGSSLVLICC